MLIPLATDRPSRRPALVSPVLIAVNAAVSIVLLLLGTTNPAVAESVYRFGQVGGDDLRWYTLITSAFLHAGFMHLAGNMVTLWVFGPPVEDRLGRGWFLAFYLAGAAASGLAHALIEAAPAVGASGAIAAVTGAFLVLFPRTRIKCLMFIFIIGIVMVPSWFLIGLRIAFDLLSQSFGVRNNIANIAHLAGYGFGIATALALLWTGRLPREPYDLLTLFTHRQRRRRFRAATRGSTAPERAARARKPDPESDDLARRRAVVSTLLAQDRPDDAADAYEQLINAHAHRPHAGTLSRDAQIRLAGHLLSTHRPRLAAKAIEGFLNAYPHDPERAELSVLLARVSARDLGDPARARRLLTPIAAGHDERLRAIAQEELAGIAAEGEP